MALELGVAFVWGLALGAGFIVSIGILSAVLIQLSKYEIRRRSQPNEGVEEKPNAGIQIDVPVV